MRDTGQGMVASGGLSPLLGALYLTPSRPPHGSAVQGEASRPLRPLHGRHRIAGPHPLGVAAGECVGIARPDARLVHRLRRVLLHSCGILLRYAVAQNRRRTRVPSDFERSTSISSGLVAVTSARFDERLDGLGMTGQAVPRKHCVTATYRPRAVRSRPPFAR